MKRTYVIGHKNPDTDSVASAMAYAELKNKLGFDVIPMRLGPMNEETKFAKKYFNIEEPDIIYDARVRLNEIELDKAIKIDINASCNNAYNLITKSSTRTLFACEKNILKGVVSISDLTSIRFMNNVQREKLLSESNIDLIASDVNGKIRYEGSEALNGKIIIYSDEVDNIGGYIAITSSEETLIDLIIKKPAMVIFVGGNVGQDVLEECRIMNVSLISTRVSIEDIIRIIYEAVPVRLIMTVNFASCNAKEYITDVASKIISTRFRSYPVLTNEGELIGSVSRYHLFNYEKNNFILVDHSSKIQTIDNIDQANVIEIIDHHHIGDIQTNVPIEYRNKTYGCTCTIIYEMFKENDLEPSRPIAGMMLSAIISDTLYFISNTTTPNDINAANALAEIAGVNLDEYARKLLAASVNLLDANIDDLIQRDLKEYKIFGNKIAIGQTNYNKMSDIQLRLNEFTRKLDSYQAMHKYDLVIMMFTSVRADGSMFLFYGPLSNVMLEILESKIDNHSGFDSTIISRKQELVPRLSKALEL